MAPNFDIAGKVIAVTGAAGGIGYACAELFLSQGAKVSLADISESGLQDTVEKLAFAGYLGNIFAQVIDVRKSKEVDDWIAKTVEKFGRLDGAANMAGAVPNSFSIGAAEDLNEPDWNISIDVNLTGVMHCMRAQLKNMNNKGSIINAASVAGNVGGPKNAAYIAAKHGVVGLTRVVAKEVGEREIRVNCIAPGGIDTSMDKECVSLAGSELEELSSPINRKGLPKEVAQLVAWLLCDASSYITGTVQVIDGGLTC
ncbi:Uncharacterized protein BP5553_00146 [Venustampulla echinocandica]|uniref:NAD(P)-binding protein n=1 Tax=Venustampulla echinocandica TaxID=2656787 RepID=A0A370TXB1_9HELO|nr:Uncharacterized protein BP5553_00146 [Venustampulla echinocandica]RDL40167.1 Uncharacterized protein BP5553_00146 [Venustampulla echinocandica]